jgi:outer membrane lipoprotein
VIRMIRWLVLAVFGAVLGGCSSTPSLVDTGPTPAQIGAAGQAQGPVHWGGQIIKVKNLSDRTVIEVLAHPLDGDGRPRIDLETQGRFLVEREGFLEPQRYSTSRLLEVRGRLQGFTDGQVGDAPYRYPVVIADTLQLWERPVRGAGGGPWVTPRIGIGIGSGSSGTRVGGGVGVGIGF